MTNAIQMTWLRFDFWQLEKLPDLLFIVGRVESLLMGKITLVDIPTSAGCLERGTQSLPRHFRQHDLLSRLRSAGWEITDWGEILLPENPRHNEPPIRNYPLSSVVWKSIREFLHQKPAVGKSDLVLGLGGDCSMVVGTTLGVGEWFGLEKVHLLYLDGDVDSLAPNPQQCAGSAGMGLWFLTQRSAHWEGKTILPSQITVIGNKTPPATDLGIRFFTLEALQRDGVAKTMEAVRAGIPQDAVLLVHFDVDILSASEMPAAYAPRPEGLSFAQTGELLQVVMADARVRYLEISELMPQRDPSGVYIRKLIETVVRAFGCK